MLSVFCLVSAVSAVPAVSSLAAAASPASQAATPLLRPALDRGDGARPCPASRGSVHANTEDALSACEQTDHCVHGARCLPCALPAPVECDVDGASVECSYSFMCDVTAAAVHRVPRWQLHDNRIQSNAPLDLN